MTYIYSHVVHNEIFHHEGDIGGESGCRAVRLERAGSLQFFEEL